MRILTLIIGLILFAQLSCSNDGVDMNSFNDDSSITTLNGTWKVISFEDYAANTVEYKSQENSWDKDIVVTFDDTLTPKLFSGNVTTNSVQGQFEYVGQREFKLKNYGSTYVSQPPWADKFGTAVLDGNVTFEINESNLRIYYDNKSKSVTMTRQ